MTLYYIGLAIGIGIILVWIYAFLWLRLRFAQETRDAEQLRAHLREVARRATWGTDR